MANVSDEEKILNFDFANIRGKTVVISSVTEREDGVKKSIDFNGQMEITLGAREIMLIEII